MTNTQADEEMAGLLSCPMCASNRIGSASVNGFYRVVCLDCGIRTPTDKFTERKQAYACWNRRTIPDPGAVSGQGWQPMDSAPKDGSIVLAWRSGWERPAFVRWVYNNRTKTTFWNDSLEWDAYEMESQPPTHWIPLSEPPKENER